MRKNRKYSRLNMDKSSFVNWSPKNHEFCKWCIEKLKILLIDWGIIVSFVSLREKIIVNFVSLKPKKKIANLIKVQNCEFHWSGEEKCFFCQSTMEKHKFHRLGTEKSQILLIGRRNIMNFTDHIWKKKKNSIFAKLGKIANFVDQVQNNLKFHQLSSEKSHFRRSGIEKTEILSIMWRKIMNSVNRLWKNHEYFLSSAEKSQIFFIGFVKKKKKNWLVRH